MPDFETLFKNVCRVATRRTVMRYLMCNAEGRLDGAEKATRHRELCQLYVASYLGVPDPDYVWVVDNGMELQEAVHEATQALTDYMDEVIGFPLTGQPDYGDLEKKFFEKFHELAFGALTSSGVSA